MWRAILLGKLVISIIASAVVGGVCVTVARNPELTFVESLRWYGLGGFFFLLSVCFTVVVFLLFRKGPRRPRKTANPVGSP